MMQPFHNTHQGPFQFNGISSSSHEEEFNKVQGFTGGLRTTGPRPPEQYFSSINTLSREQNIDSYVASSTLFVGDLSVICDEEQLFDLFHPYGQIESVQLKKSERDPQRAHLGFGFVKFVAREAAERALQALNGQFFLGRAMRVGWAEDYDKRRLHVRTGSGNNFGIQEKPVDQRKHRKTGQIHVMFVSRDLHKRVSELDLGSVFGTFGNLVDIAIKKNAINPELEVQSGYAFIHYNLTNEGVKSAVMAVEQVHNRTIDNITYQCKVTHSLQAHIFSMKYQSLDGENQVPAKNVPPTPPVYGVRPQVPMNNNYNAMNGYNFPAQKRNQGVETPSPMIYSQPALFTAPTQGFFSHHFEYTQTSVSPPASSHSPNLHYPQTEMQHLPLLNKFEPRVDESFPATYSSIQGPNATTSEREIIFGGNLSMKDAGRTGGNPSFH